MIEVSYKIDSCTYSDILGKNEIDTLSPYINNVVKVKDCNTGQILLYNAAKTFLRSIGGKQQDNAVNSS